MAEQNAPEYPLALELEKELTRKERQIEYLQTELRRYHNLMEELKQGMRPIGTIEEVKGDTALVIVRRPSLPGKHPSRTKRPSRHERRRCTLPDQRCHSRCHRTDERPQPPRIPSREGSKGLLRGYNRTTKRASQPQTGDRVDTGSRDEEQEGTDHTRSQDAGRSRVSATLWTSRHGKDLHGQGCGWND